MDAAKPRRPLLRRRVTWIAVAIAVVALVVGGLYFEPWKLVIDTHADEPVPVAAGPSATGPTGTTSAPVVLAHGELISHEHASKGSVVVIRLADGSRVLRLQDLRTSNGPALHVWLADAPVIEGAAGWQVFDDGRHLDLGDLKGNIGSSNYPLPPDADLTTLHSVSIWCARFHVSFAAAELKAP